MSDFSFIPEVLIDYMDVLKSLLCFVRVSIRGLASEPRYIVYREHQLMEEILTEHTVDYAAEQSR